MKNKGSAATRNSAYARGRNAWSKLLAPVLSSALLLSACSSNDQMLVEESTGYFGYAVDSVLVTTNAGSAVGASTDAQVLSGRLYPSSHVTGPKGQLIPNSDFVSTQVLPGTNSRVIYKISPEAKFSDGAMITCDSFLLAFTAGAMPNTFDSYMPLMDQVERVECQPNAAQATVVFKEGFGQRWRHLFSPGTLLPAHAIAGKVDMSIEELNAALKNRDEVALEPVAEVWRNGFNLDNFDPALQVSSGPYKITGVGDEGQILMERNENYWGAPASIERISVWPRGSDLDKLKDDGDLQIAEVSSMEDLGWLDRNDPNNSFDIIDEQGVLTEHLKLATGGLFYDSANRRAFAACIDQTKVASASAEVSGTEVSPITTRILRHSDPIAQRVADVASRQLPPRPNDAAVLAGQTVRIGYAGPDSRKAKMVEAIKSSCEPIGITIVDASEEASSVGDLSRTSVTEWGYEIYKEGTIDAYLGAVDPLYDFGTVAPQSTNGEEIRAAERQSWVDLFTIPLATQPRIFVVDRNVGNIIPNSDLTGIGWNLDRWEYTYSKENES